MKQAGRPFLAIFPSIVVPMFLAVVDQTIVATALPAIATSLGNAQHVSWVVIAYLISATVSAPVYGNLGDVFGRRRLLLVALAIFLTGSILCASSGTLEFLVLGRAVQGLGSGGLITLSQALLGDAFPARERGRYQGNLATIVVIASTLGPIVGGLLTEWFGWRSIFIAGIPLALTAMVLARKLPRGLSATGTWRLDIGGLFFFAAFIVLLLIALEQLRSFRTESMLLAGAVLVPAVASLVLLVWWEGRVAQPLFPRSLLAQPAVWRSYALICAHGAGLLALITFLPLYLRLELGMSASASGLMLLPMMFGIAIGSLITGYLVTATGRTAILPSIALPFAAAVFAGVALSLDHLSALALSISLGVGTLFLGSAMGVAMVILQVAAGPHALGLTSGIAQLSKSIGSAFGTAIGSTVLFIVLSSGHSLASAHFGEMLADGPAALAGLLDSERTAIQAAVTDGFRGVFLAIAAFISLGAVAAWMIPLRRV